MPDFPLSPFSGNRSTPSEAGEQSVSPVAEEITATLADGTRLVFRPIRPDDKDRLARAYDFLSPTSRHRRFFSPIEHLSEDRLRFLTEVDSVNHFAWVAVLADHPEDLVGVARWIRTSDDPEAAETAITVADPMQHRGIGRALLRLVAYSAIDRGIRRLTASVLAENIGMVQLLRELGARIEQPGGPVLEVITPLPATIEELEATAGPLILRAAAARRIVARASAGGTVESFDSPGRDD